MASIHTADGKTAGAAAKVPGGRRLGGTMLLSAGVALALTVGGVAATQFLPKVMTLGSAAAQTAQDAGKPVFVDVPEMSLTLPNDGQPKQLRIKLSLELGRAAAGQPSPEQVMPRIYDSLLTYLRTAHEDELSGSLALDRLRGDLMRRLDLVLGDGTVRDVLITSLVVG
jgi:flagellar FliL protein